MIPTQKFLKVGSQAYLYPDQGDNTFKLTCNVVGWQEGKVLLLSIPHNGIKMMGLSPGALVVVRYVLSGEVYSLFTRALEMLIQPIPLLFLAFPKKIESVSLRSQERVAVRLPTAVSWPPGGETKTGVSRGYLIDVTPSGALLEIRVPTPTYSWKKSLHLSLLLGPGEVIKVDATICNTSRSGDLCHLGVSFNWSNPADRERMAIFHSMY